MVHRSADSRAIHDHEERFAVRSCDESDPVKSGFLVTANGAQIFRSGIGLNSGNRGILKQKLNELADHQRPDTLAQLLLVGQELIDAANSEVALIRPPAVTCRCRDV